MNLEELHPDFREDFARVPSLPFGSRFWRPILQPLFNVFNRTQVVDHVRTVDRRLGPIRLRIYLPPGPPVGAGMLWIHGGGMVYGNEKQDNRTCSEFARELGLVVVSVGYRVAPQNPFPAAHDDCLRAWNWFVDNAADFGVQPERIVVCAESGGGGHAASLVHRIHDDGGVAPAAQVLLVPMLDDRTAADPSKDLGHFLWTWKDTRGGWRAYLGHEPGQVSEPDYAVAARRQDLAGLPPTWIACGTKDLFYEENRVYAQRLTDAGVDTVFLEVDRAPHGFHVVSRDKPSTRAFWRHCYAWLAETLELDGRCNAASEPESPRMFTQENGA